MSCHRMPFGAEIRHDRRVRFRLWAPHARRVEVCLEGAEAILPMAAEDDGWFGLITDLAAVDSQYRYRIDGRQCVPDPASRAQPQGVHGPSKVIDPEGFVWRDAHWRGRPWEQAVIYELHVGAFTPEGTFASAAERLDWLVELGVTAVELMPVGAFPGACNWGYDGVLPFAPAAVYGTPHELKGLIQTAHDKGLMVFLDVVYNHLGPEGNYLHLYAPQFFTERHHTPWGAAINYDGIGSGWVRRFFIHNALYWLEEYHFDGLRLDAVHAILDDSTPDVLEELSKAVGDGPGRKRNIHLVLENDNNAVHYLGQDTTSGPYAAQWNDDIHHALHVIATGEVHGYYMDYAEDPLRRLGRCLSEGFAYQGEASLYRGGRPRGEPSAHLPPTAFVAFLQNHDQVGNRAFGERITVLAPEERVRAALAILLLAPSPPLLFMGQEWGTRRPFPFFCDFDSELAVKVTEGRRREFARFPGFSDPAARQRIPDPNDARTFADAVLDWHEADAPAGRRWLNLHRELLDLRHREMVPRLAGIRGVCGGYQRLEHHGLQVRWALADGSQLLLLANLGNRAVSAEGVGKPLYSTHPPSGDPLPAWSVSWLLVPGDRTSP